MPHLKRGDKIRDFNLDCEAAYLFMGFVIAAGGQSPRNTAAPNRTNLRPDAIPKLLKEVADNLFKIRHWKFECKSFELIDNQKATWFIDPPYQFGGEVYVESNKKIDFGILAEWSKSREGQVIVCENTKADWMNFKPMKSFKGSVRMTTEAIWSNDITNFDNEQTKLF